MLPPPAAQQLFGDRLPVAQRFVALLAGAGIQRGLIGPRERDRLWDRHILNCAAVAELLPESTRVVDVGSGAGLPGLVLACLRPGLELDLVEPLERRVRFLAEAVAELQVQDRVQVIRGRAQDPAVVAQVGAAAWCTARAVAPLDRLVRWCLPLLAPGGRLLAVKGRTAEAEVSAASGFLHRIGAAATVVTAGPELMEPSVRVVIVQKRGSR